MVIKEIKTYFFVWDTYIFVRPYAELYTIAEKIFEDYKGVLTNELGFPVQGLWDYFAGPHSVAIRSVHVEQDHAVNNIRYLKRNP